MPNSTYAQRRAEFKRYADVIALWNARFDTTEISARLDLPEATIARWVANFNDVVMAS